MSTVAVIPARGGSIGIPRKNLALLNGRPLIEHTFDAVRESELVTAAVVSTDDEEIAELARKNGMQVPFLRSAELAAAETPMLPVLLDALDRAAPEADIVVLLQPTSPLRRGRHIDEALDLLERSGADAVVSVVAVPHSFTPGSLLVRAADGTVSPASEAGAQRRQDKPPFYARNGPGVYAALVDPLRSRGDLYGGTIVAYEMSRLDSVDVDDADDLALCELILGSKGR